MKQYKFKDFKKILEKNGYYYVRTNGSHSIFKNNEGIHISIPRNIESVIANRLIKQHNLKC